MIRFLYAEELKKKFVVYGSYYDLITFDGEKIKCRNILEIFKTDYHVSLSEPLRLSSSKPDSVFVMMNPGSSEPRELGFREPVFPVETGYKELSSLKMVFAKPDVTQYQVMRIMEQIGWEHVRIVNLSDIREPKSLKFFKQVKEFENEFTDVHTVFSQLRSEEREKIFDLKEKRSPVILGWGRDRNLITLAEKALEFLKDFNTQGVTSKDNPILYLHPSPNIQTAKVKWLEDIVKMLKRTDHQKKEQETIQP